MAGHLGDTPTANLSFAASTQERRLLAPHVFIFRDMPYLHSCSISLFASGAAMHRFAGYHSLFHYRCSCALLLAHRFSCSGREYKYFFVQDGTLNVAAMQEAAAHLVGLHDFRHFCKADVLQVCPRSTLNN